MNKNDDKASVSVAADRLANTDYTVKDENAVQVFNLSVDERVYRYLQEFGPMQGDEVAQDLTKESAQIHDRNVAIALQHLLDKNVAIVYRDGQGRYWYALTDAMRSFSEAITW